jgi:hypothetical protein
MVCRNIRPQIFCSNPEGATPLAILGANLLIYNKSRDTDRVCPACLRWYRVGEAFKSYSTLEEFTARPVLAQPEIEQEVATEQEVKFPFPTLKHGLANCGYSCRAYARGIV